MTELFLLLVITVILIMISTIRLKDKKLNYIWSEFNIHAILFLAGWVTFSILSGLFIVFDDLESSRDYSNQELIHGAKVGMRLMTMGFGLFILSISIFSRSNLRSKNQGIAND